MPSPDDDLTPGVSIWSRLVTIPVDIPYSGMRGQVSGVLAALLPGDDEAVFMMFRPELISRVVWGGDPRKLDTRDYRGKINPRKSFEGWEETVRSHSSSWTSSELEGMKYMKNFVFNSLIQKENLIQ